MKKFFAFLILALFLFPLPALASQNNKFGIHVSQIEDLEKAAKLVNSNGGDWGYITIVIREDDRDKKKWQDFFDKARELHLIPLVRIATKIENDIWKKPNINDLTLWVDFLDSLNWPIKKRYLIIFNEPNHAKEWGGEINPKEYAQILNSAIDLFHQKNPNFLILNAGFDQAAPNSQETMDEELFLKEMVKDIPEVFSKLDGWVSHSYPNHGFIGKPWETGRASIKGYEWELSILNKLGINKNLPVFITETGWPYNISSKFKVQGLKFYNENTCASYVKEAFEKVWLNDERVIAVTPFILNYPFYPFENFSWVKNDGALTLQFEEIEKIQKVFGEVEQDESFEVTNFFIPPIFPANFTFKGKITLLNNGQSIWGEKPFRLKAISNEVKTTDLFLPENIKIKPGKTYEFDFELITPDKGGEFILSWEGLPEYKIRVFKALPLNSYKESFFYLFFKKIFSIWYNLKWPL